LISFGFALINYLAPEAKEERLPQKNKWSGLAKFPPHNSLTACPPERTHARQEFISRLGSTSPHLRYTYIIGREQVHEDTIGATAENKSMAGQKLDNTCRGNLDEMAEHEPKQK
jgi:hypothetical protein